MSNGRPTVSLVPGELQLQALEAARRVADEHGLPAMKPCVAYLLDGNLGGAARHEAAFIIAMECRGLGLTEADTERVLKRWSKTVGYLQRRLRGAIQSAYKKNSNGQWLYFPPGVAKRAGGVYARVLSPICADIGCPANCTPFASLHRGPRGEGYEKFEKLGWPDHLRKRRYGAASDYYRAICDLERVRGFSAGAPLLTSYRQLATLARRDYRHAGANLSILKEFGLLAEFERGSGSGPRAADRLPSRLRRAVPVPEITLVNTTAITTGGVQQPQIGGGA